MKFPLPVVEARFLKREKRFFAHCRLADGSLVTAHCANSGSMRGNHDSESLVWLLDFGADFASTGRKLRYKWLSVESRGVRVMVDTSAANGIVGEALREGWISELAGGEPFVAEKKIGASRLDFWRPGSGGEPETFVEVKSVSMGEGAAGAFPDSVTERGQKHLRELMALRAAGHRAVLLFLLAREGGVSMRSAAEIDPEYDRLLREAVRAGVEVLVYGTEFWEDGWRIGKAGKLELP